MSELKKDKQEVEQVCFAYDKAGDTGDIKDWKGFYDLENKLIEKVKIANQPSLTIPQSIAEILGKYDEYNHTADKLIMMAYRDYQEFNDWIIKDWVKNDNIARAYLAGKALGVDLVKVVEG